MKATGYIGIDSVPEGKLDSMQSRFTQIAIIREVPLSKSVLLCIAAAAAAAGASTLVI